MSVAIVGFHPHSPSCSSVVSAVIAASAPAFVLIQLPVELNARAHELLLDHELPIALFSHRRHVDVTHAWWLPLTAYSPELVAARAAVSMGAHVRFIDLPAWHADAVDTADVTASELALRRASGIGTSQGLWDHLVESHDAATPTDELARRIDTFFDLIDDGRAPTPRELFMAASVRAAVGEAGDRQVVVVCRGEHRARLIDAASDGATGGRWPDVPDAVGETSSYLVPFSYARMSAPAPWWYHQLWTHGPEQAPEVALTTLVENLRTRGHRVSTPDAVNLRVVAQGLALIRGRHDPARVDLLDAAASALINESVPAELPWHRDTDAGAAAHPLVADCCSIFQGDVVGRLHPDTPMSGLIHEVEQLIRDLELTTGTVDLDLTDPSELARSRALHRFRVLRIPGFEVQQTDDADAIHAAGETWRIDLREPRIAAATESAAYGPTVQAACTAVVERRCVDTVGFDDIEAAVVDAVLTGIHGPFASSANSAVGRTGNPTDLAPGGRLLGTVLELWRHDRIFGTQGNIHLGRLVGAVTSRVLELASALRGAGSSEPGRPAAIKAVSDAQTFASSVLFDDPLPHLVALATDPVIPFDVRGAALGACWQAGMFDVSRRAMRSIDHRLVGDWLLGLFTVARETFVSTEHGQSVLAELDEVVTSLTDDAFAVALPSLRQAFEYFPPRERQIIAERIAPHTAGAAVHPVPTPDASGLDARVSAVLAQIGLR
ncbi:DUF5682 family protein [Williamsia sp.]|uniref:DUF5682 family protein n=1 Tax=Williamsia sp. TaxID=1872085 RepID=UPI001A30C5A2|nr:DUF5682 family protein [Williamsia sp.]MBJ7287509.1 hypothetical protein [Williamsia sp.]